MFRMTTPDPGRYGIIELWWDELEETYKCGGNVHCLFVNGDTPEEALKNYIKECNR